MINVGDKAPEILGINEKGEEIRLSCTETCNFSQNVHYQQSALENRRNKWRRRILSRSWNCYSLPCKWTTGICSSH